MTVTGERTGASARERGPKVVRVSDGEVALARLRVAIDRKLGREPSPVIVKIAEVK